MAGNARKLLRSGGKHGFAPEQLAAIRLDVPVPLPEG